MAKSRAQRKAEQAKKRQQSLEDRARQKQSEAQHDTQVPESGEVAGVEAVIEASHERAERLEPEPSSAPEAGKSTPEGAAEVDEAKLDRRERRRLEKERARKARESADRRAPKEVKAERQRGRVASFFASVWKELQKVQWPDRDTLVQASAVTVIFVAIAAAYLGVLDAIFSRLVELII